MKADKNCVFYDVTSCLIQVTLLTLLQNFCQWWQKKSTHSLKAVWLYIDTYGGLWFKQNVKFIRYTFISQYVFLLLYHYIQEKPSRFCAIYLGHLIPIYHWRPTFSPCFFSLIVPDFGINAPVINVGSQLASKFLRWPDCTVKTASPRIPVQILIHYFLTRHP